MELRGKIKDFKLDVFENHHELVLEVDDSQKVMSNIDLYKNKDLKIEISEPKGRRSNNANALFHVMIGRIAEKVHESTTRVKNELITNYGQVEVIDDDVVSFISNITPERMAENDVLHLKFQRLVYEEGKQVMYQYVQYRGTHTYNTSEMSHLLECTMEFARELGCIVFSPQDIERAMALWRA